MSPQRAKSTGLVTTSTVDDDLDRIDTSLLDLVDHVLNKGVVLSGDLMLGVADIDLVYLRLSAVLCAADRLLGARAGGAPKKSARRRTTGNEPALGKSPIAKKLGSPRLRAK